MKRLFPIILLMLCAALNSVAQCLTDAKVESRVRAVVPVKKSAPLRKVYGPQNSKCAVYDVDGGGFIIASTDERMPAVLGYSDKGCFARANANPAFRSMLKAFSESEPKQREPLMRRADFPAAVAPLIKDTWHQYEPFWQRTPQVDGEQCLTGCVAHAMAEVMYYYRYPERGTGSHTYTDSLGCKQTLTANFAEHVYDWDNILNAYVEGEYTQKQVDAVAQLLSDCGIAVNMRYTPAESGAYTIYQPLALTSYFGYDRGIQIYFRDFFTWQEWNDMLMTELSAGRPVLMAGHSNSQAHAYVCDGYDEQGFYHLNWGWEGEADGYYNIQYMSPDLAEWYDKDSPERGLNLLQVIVAGVQPPKNGQHSAEVHSFGMSGISALDDAAERGGELSVVTCDLSNLGWNLHDDRVALALKGDEGVVSVLKDYAHEFLLEEIDDTTYTDTLRFTVPESVSNGVYRLVPVFLDNGEWREARTSVGTPNYLRTVVRSDSVLLSEPIESKASLTFIDTDIPDTLVQWSIPDYSFTLRNDGAEFCGRVYMCLEPVDGSDRRFVFNQQGMTLMPGEVTTRTFHRTVFAAPPPGVYFLTFYNDVNLFNDSLAVLNDVPRRTVRVVTQAVSIDGVDGDPSAATADALIYSVSGILVGRMSGVTADTAVEAVRQLDVPSGLYVVRCGDKVVKIIK
jgi:hypothetical protein